MDFKIVAKADVDSQSEYADTDSRSGLQSSKKVYDIIISHRRKFYFNTAEDSVASLANGGFSLYKAEVLGDESERKETV